MTFPQFGIGLLLIGVFVVASLAPAQNDTFWQLRSGQAIWATGQVPLTDTYSHTVAGAFWPNHSWLWQALAYGLFTLGGFPLLNIATAIVATATVALAAVTMGGEPTRLQLLLLAAGVPILMTSVSVRPQASAMLLFAALLWLIATERFAAIPLLMLLWANLHASVVMGGLLLAVATALAVYLARRWPSPTNSARAKHLSVVLLIGAAATLVTPLGLGLWTYVTTSLSKVAASGVQEFQPSYRSGWSGAAVTAWALALLVLAAFRWRRLSIWSERLVVAASVALVPFAIAASRNSSWLVLASLPALTALLAHKGPPPAKADSSRSHLVILAAAGTVAVALVPLAWRAAETKLNWHPVPPAIRSAVHECPGPLYNTYDDGGYLIWSTPETPVFIDSRYDPYPQQFFEAHVAAERSGDYRPTFTEFGIRCAALPPSSPTASALLRDGWRRAAETSEWVVLGAP